MRKQFASWFLMLLGFAGLIRPQIISSPSAVSEFTFGWGSPNQTVGNGAAVCPTIATGCPETVFAKVHTIVRFTYILNTSPAGCTTALVVGVNDNTSGSVLTSLTVANGATTGFVDSGALSVATTAGHRIGVGPLTSPAGCTTSPSITALHTVFQ